MSALRFWCLELYRDHSFCCIQYVFLMQNLHNYQQLVQSSCNVISIDNFCFTFSLSKISKFLFQKVTFLACFDWPLRLVYIGGFVRRFRRTFSPKISIIFIPLASHFSFLGTLDTLDVTVSKIGNFLFFKPLRHKVGHLTYLGYN